MNFLDKSFIVTTEITPPRGPVTDEIIKSFRLYKDFDAVNVTTNPGGRLHMDSIAFAIIMKNHRLNPIAQISCRDSNSLAIQSQLLGAHASGIRNISIMRGDPVKKSRTVAVYEQSSDELMLIIKKMNSGLDKWGEQLNGKTGFIYGGVLDAEHKDKVWLKKSYKKKIDAGVTFFQTQPVIDIQSFIKLVRPARRKGIKIIPSVVYISTNKTVEFIKKNIPGLRIHPKIIEQIKKKDLSEEEALNLLLMQIKEIQVHCDGVHIISWSNKTVLPKILKMVKI